VQILQAEVFYEVAGGAATAGAPGQDYRIDQFGLDTGVFDGPHGRFEREFQCALFGATSVRRLPDADDTGSVS